MPRFPIFLLLLPAIACSDEPEPSAPSHPAGPQFTMGEGTTPTPLGRANFADPDGKALKIKRMEGDFRVDVKAAPSLDIAVQRITFAVGGHSGWHRHPGPVFIQVLSGEMTFYEADDPLCEPIVRDVGQGYLDLGEHGHIARNEGDVPAENLVVYLAPPAPAPLRIDVTPAPGNCPF